VCHAPLQEQGRLQIGQVDWCSLYDHEHLSLPSPSQWQGK
jgi:hypothetical protein